MARNVRKMIREGVLPAKERVKCDECLDTGYAWRVKGMGRFCNCESGKVSRDEYIAKMKAMAKKMIGLASKPAEVE